MKTALSCLIVFTVLLNFSCGRNIESSPVAANEKPVETLQPAMPQFSRTPVKYEEFDIIEKFSRDGAGKVPISLEYKDYKISPVKFNANQ